MNFAELRFWEILGGAWVFILGLRALLGSVPEWYDKVALLSVGLLLLLCMSEVTFVIFLVVAVGSYFGLKWILRLHGHAPRRYLFILIPLQLLPLIFYKYGDFFFHSVFHLNLAPVRLWLGGATGHEFSALRDLVIPVGISFYTFQKVAFVVDTISFKQPLPGFLDYMNFAGFFPQIVAGPIERRGDLLPQMECFRISFTRENINTGVGWIVLGLFFKCALADNLGDRFNASNVTNAYAIWAANVIFGFRIYFDFAGYSFIAMGLARCLGIRLTLNFCSPYLSTSATDFWRRWHITLSQWFRDYLYIPLGGGRAAWWSVNIAIVFLVSGLWHGAGWGFILWGGSHGVFLILNRFLGKRIPLPAFIGWLLTLMAAFFAWLCFYEPRPAILLQKIQTLATPSAYSPSLFPSLFGGFGNRPMPTLAICALVLFIEWLSISRKNEPYYYFRRPVALCILIVAIVFFAPETNSGFIYFAF
jgi:alginate O-acetyltransferase complex protein AlgI